MAKKSSVLKLKTSDYDFTEVEGISGEIYEELVDRFPTVDMIVTCKMEELTDIDGVGEKRALAIKEAADTILLENSAEGAAVTADERDPSIIPASQLFDHKPTARERRQLASQRMVNNERTTDKDARYILVEIPIDKNFKRRTRVKITPATCELCGYDVCMVNQLKPYNELSAVQQEEVLATLRLHTKNIHSTAATKAIITQEEYDHIQWETPVTLRPPR